MEFSSYLLSQESLVRLLFFVGGLVLFTTCEMGFPRQAYSEGKWFRWVNNILITMVNSLLLRVLFPLLAVHVALWASENHFGFFNQFETPSLVSIVLCFAFFDHAVYWQHVIFHRVPVLWRLHRMHHTDTQFDASTALRFHGLEIILSMLIKMALVALIGAPVIAVLVFEVVLNFSAMFNHSNWKLFNKVDRVLRWFIVTPDMHRIHHSVHKNETDSNYGFALSIWDKIYKSYVRDPKDGQEKMTIGLSYERSQKAQRLDQLLIQPFKKL